MFCANCGDKFNGKFCPACGAPAAGEPAAVPPQGATAASQAAGLADNAAGALCYLAGLISGILFLALEPYSRRPAIRFHAFQSILFHAAWVGLIFAEMTIGFALPFALSIFVHLFGILVLFGGFLLWIYLMWKAYQNQPVVLPWIGDIAKRQSASV